VARINVVTPEAASAEQKALFAAIQSQLGVVPNFLKVFANSPEALKAFLGLHGIASAGSLDMRTRERIALALAQQNGCQYCLSAHTAIGRKAGLDGAEIEANRAGTSHDAKAAAAVRFARALVEHAGDAEIVEIITHVGMNILTNILGRASRVDIDFPKVELKLAA